MQERPDVLITQAWGRTAYNVARSLGQHGLRTVLGTDKFSGMAVFSRYSRERFRHPLVTSHPASFAKSVKEALQRYSPRVYFPMGDDTYVAAKYLEELEQTGVAIPVSPFETLRRLHKKNEVMALARAVAIPTPETIVPRTEDDMRCFGRAFGFPIVLKRTCSSGARGVFHVTEDQIAALWENESFARDLSSGRFVLQEHVRGDGNGVSMLFNQGQLRATFTHKRLREKTPRGGISTVRMSVVNPAIEEHARRLLESVNYHGVAMVEFKHDEKSGKSWLLEVNPRFWGSLALAIQSGVDFPYLLYRMATEGDVSPVCSYRTGVIVKWILGDLGAVFTQWRQARRSPRHPDGERSSDGYDDWYWDDPFPFFGEAVLGLRKILETRRWPSDALDLNIEQLEHASHATTK